MQLALPTRGLSGYKSHPQRVRIATEHWGRKNLYCLNCDSNRLVSLPAGIPVVDFLCPRCYSPFQLKSQSEVLGDRILDAAYNKMSLAVRMDRTPNLFALHYDRESWEVLNLILVPRFAFSLSAIERRKPLAATAQRAGWIGCYIALTKIPSEAKIPIVIDGRPQDPRAVRCQFSRIRPLAKLEIEKRGWTLDVLSLVRSLGKREFSLKEAYSLKPQLASLHPNNRHIDEKIRQQLQVLRDLGFLAFLGNGRYVLS